ncbi:MAG: FAD-dependent oxidoreductase, partial [Gammaproteobacteria bacterium]|nr:FAD-dependent oxidoreductase [Gammaproteobacteria bacterium]
TFSVHSRHDDIEYNGASLNGLFAQRRNLLRPSYFRMIRDILRFNKRAPSDANDYDATTTVGEYLNDNGYGRHFAEHYLIPMAAAIWSAEPIAVYDMPLKFLIRFFANHGLLQLRDRPQWRVIKGGSREYVTKLIAGHRDRIRLNSPVEKLRRDDMRIQLFTRSAGWEDYDYAFVACHSDQALAMLDDATPSECDILGAILYQENEATLHTDVSLMPRRRRAWAAWNYHLPEDSRTHVAVTYNMNQLQRLNTATPYLVTLNNDREIDTRHVIRRMRYEHPVFSLESIAAQARHHEINCDRTYFCGAYWHNGFHEDGVVSALNALEHFEGRLADAKLHLRRAS